MKVLVTGATGFIGNYVIKELIEKGVDVIATSTNADKASATPWYSGVEFIPFDFKSISTETNYYTYFKKPDKVIHLAWEGLPNYNQNFHITENLPRHYIFLSNLISNGLKDITVSGTCLEYGMKEGCLSEEIECVPNNSYSIAKNELRKSLQLNIEKYDAVLKWVRLFYIYGKGQSTKSLISQLETAIERDEKVFNMSGGKQVRDFLPIQKVAANISNIALQNKIIGIINCCSSEPIKVKDFVEDYLKRRNKAINLNLGYYPYPDYEPFAFWGDDKKLKEINQLYHDR